MKRPQILNQIREYIISSENNTVFVPNDFSQITDNKSAGIALMRLETEGLIKRILRGVYYKAYYNAFLDEYVLPEPNKVAEAIARNYRWTITPCGDTALNLLGLSTQVPAIWLYVSDGKYKEYCYDNVVIRIKKTTNKEISMMSYKTALVIQAIKAVGKENIDSAFIIKLSNQLTDDEKDKMYEEAKTATSWVYQYIKTVCGR